VPRADRCVADNLQDLDAGLAKKRAWHEFPEKVCLARIMGADLTKYRAKRNFDRTPEPAGRASESVSGRPQFVVQKHDARRLHYDFRLEHDGVLKSWAVPKGPSLDPRERRLAVQTEDHPLEYATFEGVIPEREYGGGAVIVWDRGHWSPESDPDEGLAKGKLDFTLHGEKLRGRWTLVRLAPRGKEKDNWLLIKRRDREARDGDGAELVDTLPESVLTGRGIAEVAASRDRIWHSSGNGEESPSGTPAVGRPDTVPGAKQAALPRRPTPQRPTPADAVPDDPGWFHEPKLVGCRVLCRVANAGADLHAVDDEDTSPRSRRASATAGTRSAASSGSRSAAASPSSPLAAMLASSAATAPLVAALRALPCDSALVDGVVAAFDEHGVSDRARLERALADDEPDEVVLVVVDLLYLDGWDLRGAPLRARKELLRLLTSGAPRGIRYSDHVEGHGESFYREACRLGLPAVVSKRADAPYRGGASNAWLVTPCRPPRARGAERPRRAKARPR